MNKRTDIFLGILLIAILLILSWRIFSLSAKVRAYKPPGNPYTEASKDYFGTVIPAFSLPSVSNESSFEFSPQEKGPFYLFILFTPRDCQDCFKEIPFWNRLGETFKNIIQVVAIGAGGSRMMINNFGKLNEIHVPTFYDQNDKLFKCLGLDRSFLTPAKILVNSKGTILHLGPSTHNDTRLQEEYVQLLERLIW